MFRLVRIIVNSFAGCMMLIMGGIFWSFDPILAVVLFLASIDQFEDVYYFVYGKRLIPDWLMPVDVVFEGVVGIRHNLVQHNVYVLLPDMVFPSPFRSSDTYGVV